jgi:uncharacterized SAM-binding protein YcdF (DUF218 family)
MYFFLILALFCLIYYIVCALYAGISSSFIFIWLIGAALFGGIFALLYMQARNIFALPVMLKRILCGILTALFVLFFALEIMVVSGMGNKPAADCEYMIVLGCQIRGSRITRSLRKRLDTAYEYAKDGSMKIIVSGGQGRGEDMSEAQAMKNYLVDKGIDADRIIMEDKSTDTSENIRYSAEYINDNNAKICVITNNFHVFRAKKIAKGCGFTNVSGAAAGSDPVLLLNYMVREAIGIVKDFVFGNF